MGFGLICAGLTTLLFLRLVPAELVGFAVIAMGLRKLSVYNGFFKGALYCAYAIIAFSAVDAVFWILKLCGLTDGLVFLESILSYTHMLLLLPFQIILSRALMTISASLGFDKGVKRAVMSTSVVSVYYLVYALSCISTPFDVYLDFATLILFFINLAILISAVHVCYRAITTDEAEAREDAKIEKFEKQFGRKKDGKVKSGKKKK